MKKLKKAKAEFDRIKGYLTHHFRLAWRFYSEKRKACIQKQKCEVCGKTGYKKDFVADHINPVVDPAVGFVDWTTYGRRMFDGGLQCLCDPCHKIKTLQESAVRRATRAARNKTN